MRNVLLVVAAPKPAKGSINEKTVERTSSDDRARWLRRAALRVKGISFVAIRGVAIELRHD